MQKIFGAFSPPSAPQSSTQQVQNQGAQTNNLQQPPSQGTKETQQTAPNGLIPDNTDASPVAKFNTLWEPPKPEVGNNLQQKSDRMTAEQMMEAAQKVDFTKVLDQETLAKITAGGEGAVQALVDSLNKTAQNVFAQSTIVTQTLVDRASAKTRDELSAQIPSLVKRQNFSQQLLADNPAFAHPAVAPMITALQSQLQEKYPKATQAELKQLASEYLTGVAEIVTPKQKTNASNQSMDPSDAVDWEKYLSS
jgi:hypothetical protein